jgi:hypothetical protein
VSWKIPRNRSLIIVATQSVTRITKHEIGQFNDPAALQSECDELFRHPKQDNCCRAGGPK